VPIGISGVGFCVRCSGVQLCLLRGGAAGEGSTLLFARNGEAARHVDIRGIIFGVDVDGGAGSIDVGEEIRRLDGVHTLTGASEVVCRRHWGEWSITKLPIDSVITYSRVRHQQIAQG
jgi:hypothetical protein